MKARMVNRGRYAAFGHPSHCVGALCEDGKRRTIRLRLEAGCWFAWDGDCKIGGKSVKGFVSIMEGEDYGFFVRKAAGAL